MNRSLGLKIPLLILGVSLLSIALVALVARWVTVHEFDRLIVGQIRADFAQRVRDYYLLHHSWDGVIDALPPPRKDSILSRINASAIGKQAGPNVPFALLDQQGCVVIPSEELQLGDCPLFFARLQPEKLMVNGQVVGTVLTLVNAPTLTGVEQAYLARTNRAVLWSGIGAAAFATLLGLVISRRMIRPLRELTAAIHATVGSETPQNVPVKTQDELGEVAAAFNQMSADLAQANQARRQMTADIAHELRNPLMVMIGYLEAMREGVLKPTSERIGMMYDEALHLQHLVNDLRTLSLADAGKLTLQVELTSAEELLQRVVNAYLPQAEQKKIQLQTAIEEQLPDLNLDPVRMVQVLGNLVSNALRHTSAGGTITLGAEQQADRLQLSVADNGEGIPAEALPHIFDRFYRADPARPQDDGSSGLGLAIVKSIVSAHNGTIEVQSALGKGTTFRIGLKSELLPLG